MKPKQERRQLAELYAQIPTFDCIPGCHDCCGPVDGSKEELKRAPKLAAYHDQLNFFVDANVVSSCCATCPYVTPAGCGIYEDRPFICRLFGATEDPKLRCPHGRGPSKKLSLAQTDTLYRRYRKILGPSSEEQLALNQKYLDWVARVKTEHSF